MTADYLLGLEDAPTHVEADICSKTGLSEKAVRGLVLNAVYVRCERRDLEEGRLGSSGMFYKALDHLIAHGFGILFDIATYLFTDIKDVPEINFTHDGFTVALTDNKEYIFAGILNTINEGLVKERDILKNGAARESDLLERPKGFVDNRFELIDKEMREMGIEEW